MPIAVLLRGPLAVYLARLTQLHVRKLKAGSD